MCPKEGCVVPDWTEAVPAHRVMGANTGPSEVRVQPDRRVGIACAKRDKQPCAGWSHFREAFVAHRWEWGRSWIGLEVDRRQNHPDPMPLVEPAP